MQIVDYGCSLIAVRLHVAAVHFSHRMYSERVKQMVVENHLDAQRFFDESERIGVAARFADNLVHPHSEVTLHSTNGLAYWLKKTDTAGFEVFHKVRCGCCVPGSSESEIACGALQEVKRAI